MIVTEVRPRRKHLTALKFNCDLAELELECNVDDYGFLLLNSELIQSKNIVQGTELDQNQLRSLIFESEMQRAKSKAIWLLSRQDYSSGRLFKKLRETFSKDAASFATEYISELGFINDEDYAMRLADSLLNEKRLSARQAVYKMIEKGVSRELAEQTIESFEVNPVLQIKELLNIKYRNKLQNENDIKKTIAALARRGFSFGDIKSALREIIEENEIYEE